MKSVFRLFIASVFTLCSICAYSQTLPTVATFQSIEVLQKSTFSGELKLDSGLTIKGLGNFLDPVQTLNGLSVEKTLKVLGLPENIDGTGLGGVLVKRVDGIVEYITFDNLSKLIPGIENPSPCANGPDGNPINQPASWKYNGDIIYTNECTPDVRVGIGVTAPIEKLEVAGNARLSGYIRAGRNVTTGARNQLFGLTDIGKVTEYISIGHDGSHSVIESHAPQGGDINNSDLHINYNTGNGVIIGGNTALSKTSYLKVGGNAFVRDRLMVGSGNDNPLAALHIKTDGNTDAFIAEIGGVQKFKVNKNGVAYAREVNITLENPFPDYVFKEGYPLKSLKEVEEHIRENGTLPGMPSAKHIAENGADMGELVRLLTEKVEELTLYTIALQKEIEALKKTR